MKKQFNKETFTKEWIIDTWYQKIYYIMGILFSTFIIISFIFSLIAVS